MGQTRTTLTTLSLALVLGGRMLAADPEPEPDKRKKPTEVASATVTITAEATAVEIEKTPASVKVVPLERLERESPRDLGDLLQRLMPGQLISYGGPGTSASLYLGGTKAGHTVVMVDGIRIKDSSSLGTDYSAFGTAGIDRVEVLQGAASTLYGADAHGGVVSLMSEPVAATGFQGAAVLATGNQGVGRTSVRTAYGWKQGWVTTSLALGREQPTTAVNTNYRSANGHVGMGLRLGEEGLLTFNHRSSFQGVPLPFQWSWPGNKRTYDATSDSTSRMEVTQMGYRQALTSELLMDVNVGQTESNRYYSSYGSRYFGRSRQALGSLVITPRQDLSITALGDAQLEEAWSADPGQKNVGRHLALASEAAWEPMEALRLVGSLRHQWDRVGRTKADVLVDEAPTEATVWRAGVNVRWGGGIRSYVSAGTAYNTPSLANQRWNLDRGKDTLRNETSRTLCLGTDWQKDALFAKAELSRTTYSDLVNFVGVSPTGYYINTKSARIQGAELSAGRTSRAWTLSGFVRLQEGRDLSLPEEKQLTSFAARPFSTVGLRGSRTWQAWSLEGSLTRLGHRYNYFSDTGLTQANRTHFTDANLRLAYQVDARLSLSLRGDHLFQGPVNREAWERGEDLGRNDVAVFPGFLAQSRTLTLEARYRF